MSEVTFTHQNHVYSDRPGETATHHALFYRGDRDYLDGVMHFIAPALKAGEPVVAAIPPGRGQFLRRELSGCTGEVEILDMFELGRNPARIIPATERLLAKHQGTTLHCLEEPVWPGRSPDEFQEAAKHEALINLAWPGAPIRLLCLYDAEQLPPEVLRDAERTHAVVIEHGSARRTSSYTGAAVPRRSDEPLPPVPADAREFGFTIGELHQAREMVDEEASAAGLKRGRVEDLILAVSELATNAIRHGHGHGVLRVWRRPDRLICQVEDGGTIRDPLAGRRLPVPRVPGGIGLWAVNQLCDLVEVRSTKGGTTIRVHALVG